MAISVEQGKPFSILIVGGGIAGLSTAIALRKANRSITILEQSRLNREIGATISLQPNASKYVEKQWGLGPALKAKGSMVDKAFRICSVDGKEFKRVDLSAKAEYGGDRMLYHRQDLHDTLKDAAVEGGAILKIASRVVECDCEAGSVVLENGTTLDGFDLIIGADGIRSNMRKFVAGKEAEAVKTGQAAYRMMIKGVDVEGDEEIRAFLDPRESVTTMVMGHKVRLIMGPARNGDVYSIVAMVPDTSSEETETSWTTKGNMDDLLECFKDFPDWCKRLFSLSPELGLWQLRDVDSLSTWTKGKLILIGDAAHAMLPTQGQGASQCIEDVEALQAFFDDIQQKPTTSEVIERLKCVDEVRRPRATQIQLLSREAAKPATEIGNPKINISPDQYMDYCCTYHGALAWKEQEAR